MGPFHVTVPDMTLPMIGRTDIVVGIVALLESSASSHSSVSVALIAVTAAARSANWDKNAIGILCRVNSRPEELVLENVLPPPSMVAKSSTPINPFFTVAIGCP